MYVYSHGGFALVTGCGGVHEYRSRARAAAVEGPRHSAAPALQGYLATSRTGRGATRGVNTQGTPTQSQMSPIIIVCENDIPKSRARRSRSRSAAFPAASAKVALCVQWAARCREARGRAEQKRERKQRGCTRPSHYTPPYSGLHGGMWSRRGGTEVTRTPQPLEVRGIPLHFPYRGTSLPPLQGGVPREQKMLKGHLTRVIYHHTY